MASVRAHLVIQLGPPKAAGAFLLAAMSDRIALARAITARTKPRLAGLLDSAFRISQEHPDDEVD